MITDAFSHNTDTLKWINYTSTDLVEPDWFIEKSCSELNLLSFDVPCCFFLFYRRCTLSKVHKTHYINKHHFVLFLLHRWVNHTPFLPCSITENNSFKSNSSSRTLHSSGWLSSTLILDIFIFLTDYAVKFNSLSSFI